jgi:putative nucleotidyltransferase with HDIG domain
MLIKSILFLQSALQQFLLLPFIVKGIEMENRMKSAQEFFVSYVDSFTGLAPDQQENFAIKKEHSLRVAENAGKLGNMLNLNADDQKVAYLSGLLHDIGRFEQLANFNTFNDTTSVDHAEHSVKVLKDKNVLADIEEEMQDLVFFAIFHHNKLQLPKKGKEREKMHSRLLRDADKLDILRVLTDYYSDKNKKPNHTLTWELPPGGTVSKPVAKEILAGRLVPKEEVKNETDVKIMQLSWVFDLNFKPSFEIIFENRLFEKIYNTLPKTDMIIEIYRKVKVYSENKLLE